MSCTLIDYSTLRLGFGYAHFFFFFSLWGREVHPFLLALAQVGRSGLSSAGRVATFVLLAAPRAGARRIFTPCYRA